MSRYHQALSRQPSRHDLPTSTLMLVGLLHAIIIATVGVYLAGMLR